MNQTTIALSLPAEQLELLETVRYQNEKIISYQTSSTYLTEPEACERLKVSLTTIRKWRKDGWLRYFAEGDNIRYRVDYLDSDFESRALVKAPLLPTMKQVNRKAI
ncbi:helix-turn-helix domain-containing protein [Dyadobacter diqingensis]|uniref:helix-turn-helix domain-containing protein n=1 Tax=Dyadobacter diqingensis TaxID=2938121 RepID=UPI0020C26D80|nr:helix-turn-helix domain-containing protein [Dyadobacter diqingensis]